MGSNQSITDKKVNLKGKGLKNIDKDVKRYDLLKSMKCPRSIVLSHNKITELSPAICEEVGRMKNVHEFLRELNLSHNKIGLLPEAFMMLINLSKLRLDHNEIEVIPETFADSFYNLESLQLDHNKIKSVPWNFNKLVQLRSLYLNNNYISFLPNTFGELRLEELVLQENPLDPSLFSSNTIEGTLEAITVQKIPKEHRENVRVLVEGWEREGKGKTELERQFLFFLQQYQYRKSFFAFMQKEFSHENLDFWQRVDEFKRRYNSILEVRAPELVKEAIEIYKTFIAEGSPHSINIPATDGQTLKTTFIDNSGINQWVFDNAYESILNLMYSDTFSRYKLSEEGRTNFLAAVKMWEALPVNRMRRFNSNH